MVRRSIEGWGVRARLECDDAAALAASIKALPAGFRCENLKGSGVLFRVRTLGSRREISRDGVVLWTGRPGRVFSRLFADQLETLAATTSRTFAFLHAGAVEIEGRAILFPGRSFAGKSTLVAAFLRRGACYLSDDMAPIDRNGWAHPFPRPMAVRSLDGRASIRTPARRLGARTADGALPVGLVWCGRFQAGTRRPSFVRRIGTAAFAEILAHAPAAQLRPETVLPILAAVTMSAPVYRGVRGEADAMVDALLRVLKRKGTGVV